MAVSNARVTSSHTWLNVPHDILVAYNAADCVATIRGAKALRRALEARGQWEFYRTRTWATVPSVLAMQARGLPYDPARKTAYRRKLRAELRETDSELRRLFAEHHDGLRVRVACALQTLAWVNPDLGIPGWFGKAPSKRLKPSKAHPKGRISRRPAPFTKSEWSKLAKDLPHDIKDAKGKQLGFNPGSDAHIRRWLFGALGLRPSTKTPGGAASVNQDALNRILQRKPTSKAEAERIERATPVIHRLMHRARLEQIDQQYLDPQVIEVTDAETESSNSDILQGTAESRRDRLHAQGAVLASSNVRSGAKSILRRGIRQPNERASGGTLEKDVGLVNRNKTIRGGAQGNRRGEKPTRHYRVYPRIKLDHQRGGRHSYADPPVHSWPSEIRHIVRARPGHSIVGLDYSAIESRVFAHLTEDTKDLATFAKHDETHDPVWDIHVRTAAELLGEPPEAVVALRVPNPEGFAGRRGLAKGFRYGTIQYGGDPATVKGKVFCPCERCRDRLPPTLDLTAEQRVAQARRWFAGHPNVIVWRSEVSRQARSRRWIENPWGRRLYLTAPWSNDLERFVWNWHIQSTAREIIRTAEIKCHRAGLPAILQHHDALYFEVPDHLVAHTVSTARAIMEAPVAELGGMVFVTDPEVGPSWGELDHYHD